MLWLTSPLVRRFLDSYIAASAILSSSRELEASVGKMLTPILAEHSSSSLGLSLRLRRREIETIVKIGGSRAAVTGLLISEVVFVLVLGAVLAGLLTGLFARYGDSTIRALFFT